MLLVSLIATLLAALAVEPAHAQDPRCSNTAGALYQDLTQSCFLLAGAQCDKEMQTPPYPCLPNSVCLTNESGDDVCTCFEGLAPNNNSFCYLDHQAACNLQRDLCDPAQRLSCSTLSGLCGCDQYGDSYFDPMQGCVLRAGTKCGRQTSGLQCGANADCVLNPDPDLPSSHVCVCQGQLIASEEGHCLAPHGWSCDGAECLPPFVCHSDGSGNKCVCPEGTYYDGGTDTCFIMANHTCMDHLLNERLECTPNSECSSRTKKCKCDAPLNATARGTCHLAHGDDCEGAGGQCDPATGLVCMHSVCECAYGTHFDRGACRVMAGLPCDPGQRPCVFGAECRELAGQWQCSCVSGTSPSVGGLCVLSHGARCDEAGDVDCDPSTHLTCVGGVCACANGMEYFPSGCRLQVGSSCFQPTPTPPCIPHAECVNRTCTCLQGYEGPQCHVSFGFNCSDQLPCVSNMVCAQDVCGCPSGYNHFPLITLQCLPGYQQECLPDNGSCSPTLECNAGGLCQCVHPHQVYSPTQEDAGRCVSLVGAACTPRSDPRPMHCTANAECVEQEGTEDDMPRFGLCECSTNFTTTYNQTCVEAGAGVRAGTMPPTYTMLSIVIVLFLLHE